MAKQALEVINHLQSEVERYKSLWKTCEVDFVSLQGKSNEIIAELKAKDEWQDISSAPKLEQVLVFYRNCFGNSRIVIARYLPKGTECECSDDCGCEYDDEKEMYVIREGWYEQIDNWGDYSEVAISEGEPTHWRYLPKPPEQNH